ncbi:MAG: formate dehydrogenase accessory protein FdhE [Desulfobacterales bacterium]|nr:MAG: formate dehydrogenase accessory protein FdhE [Desulfobacterales bacterium]
MTATLDLSPDQVMAAVEAVKKNRPVYAGILEFYGRLFVAQEESKRRLRIEPIRIAEDIRSVKAREKFPLIEVKDFAYDRNEAAKLLVLICRFAKEANPKLAESAKVLLAAVESGLESGKLFSGLLGSDEALFENISAELVIEKKVLGFITYNSLKPSLCACADQLSVYLNKNEPWLAGYCPICGSAPILSILKDEGERSLICSFCWHQWSVKRVYCPFCNNSDNKDLRYLFSEENKSLRVDLCDNCNKYIKTIDTRRAERLIYPPLEQIASLHLDIKAQEEGFEAGVKLFMEI